MRVNHRIIGHLKENEMSRKGIADKPSNLMTPEEFIDLFFGETIDVERDKNGAITSVTDPFFARITRDNPIVEELGELKCRKDKMNEELSTLTEMLDLLIESNSVLSHSDCDDELALAGRISRVIPDAAQMVIKTMAGQVRLMEQALDTATGKRQTGQDDDDLPF